MRVPTRLAASVALAAALTAPTGCSGSTDEAFTVVAAFYPLEFLAERVTGADVRNLVRPGAEPHDLELTVDQMATLVDADLVIYLKGFQPAVDEAVAQQVDSDKVLDVSQVRPLLTDAGGQPDPHLWLDPTRYSEVADAVARTLSGLAPDRRAQFQRNAKSLAAELTTLDREYSDALAECEREEIVVSHAAYGYLAARYRVDQVAIAGLSPDQEPTPRRLAEVAEVARKHQTTVIFFETLVSPKLAQTLAREVGAKAMVLDPIEGLAPGSRDDYFTVMRRNLAGLRDALGCR